MADDRNSYSYQDGISGWILFQFDRPRFIREVVIYNRADCCIIRLFPFEIHVIDEDGQIKKCQDKSFTIGDPEIPTEKTNPIHIECGNLHGKSVKLAGMSGEALNICEIEIFGYW